MFEENVPVVDSVAQTSETTTGNNSISERNNTSERLQSQQKQRTPLIHNPAFPIFYERQADKKPLLYIIKKIWKRLKKAYYNRHRFLVHLNLLNPSERRKYSQRMEAICNVAMVLIEYHDFRTMKTGIPRKFGEGLIGITIKKIAELTQMTITRVKNALRDLKDAQYLNSVRQLISVGEGAYRSQPSVRSLSKLFFYHLGITETQLRKVHEYKKKIKEIVIPTFERARLQKIRDKAHRQKNRKEKNTEPISDNLFRNIIQKLYQRA